ncbi:MAG: hypothetical protein A3I75_03625 [Deltaproteobacteria bacterium RIFCSPLOWO2_02_FULL_50_16]|nr:MAG: hypothetical protein A3B79_01725 [Deltaproteobacteria bacterium RIFCSPHIGHO2_02_FULL_50_15]OGQ55631.1 MAG: hypothetical protein A3I75_03625 [Deltaproteobacteria bacterium RIFCSPLOWO2_02_FULL_50_16]OGQ67649.1 MAG: hypothetical protein A3F89_04115 [Deltaproteobacteria bacterium RIFCSPLOWO2_12_FULL_50_11]
MAAHFFVKRDLDGFFGLAIDNAVQILLMISLLPLLCGIPVDFVYRQILPGVALSILFGNLFYSFQAWHLTKKERRDTVTALPYGINTLSLFAFIFFIMAPVWRETKSFEMAWQMGMVACLLSGAIEFFGAFLAPLLRRVTPRPALLSALAGVAITFLAMEFALRSFDKPLIALIPLAIILLQYFGRVRFPMGLSGGLVAVLVGTLLAWALGEMDFEKMSKARQGFQLYLPGIHYSSLIDLIVAGKAWKYLSIIVPMGVFNLVGSLQNLESAEAAGDKFGNISSLTVNGLGSILAASLGSCFPTTIYIGHPGWKALGARAGYSTLNGLFMGTLCLTGLMRLMATLVPIEAGFAIVMWVGIIIVAQAFQTTGYRHAPAVALGFLPCLAAWGTILVQATAVAAGATLSDLETAMIGSFSLRGMLILQGGFLFGSIIWVAIVTHLIDRSFWQATVWALVAGVLAYTGVIHSYLIKGNDIHGRFGWGVGKDYAIVYGVMVLLFFLAALFSGGKKKRRQETEGDKDSTLIEREESLVHHNSISYKY